MVALNERHWAHGNQDFCLIFVFTFLNIHKIGCNGRLHLGSCGGMTVIPKVNQRPGPDVLHLQPSRIAIILKGTIVMDE